MPTTPNYGWPTPANTDYVKDGAQAMRNLGDAIDTTVKTNSDAAVNKSIVDAKGDLIAGTADNTVAKVSVGTDGHVLTADSTQASGVKWAAVAAGATRYYQAFTSSQTWTVPATAKYVDVMCVGGGSGGKGGFRTTSAIRAGGGGAITFVRDVYLGGTGTVAVTVGLGTNGTAGTNTTSSTDPSKAGYSAFGTYVYSSGGGNTSSSIQQGGVPGYKGTVTSINDAQSYLLSGDTTETNWAPSMTATITQNFYQTNALSNGYQTIGMNANGFFGGQGGEATAGGTPGQGAMGTRTVNTIPQAFASIYTTAIGTASAGSAGVGNGAGGGPAGIPGFGGGGGSQSATANAAGYQGGPGAGGGGSTPGTAGGNGGNGGAAGANTGAGGGAGGPTASTTLGTGGSGGNGAAGIVIVSWVA